MFIDFWYNNTLADVAKISCVFYGNEAVYRGWLYDQAGKIIGDYSTQDSLLIETTFNVLFND